MCLSDSRFAFLVPVIALVWNGCHSYTCQTASDLQTISYIYNTNNSTNIMEQTWHDGVVYRFDKNVSPFLKAATIEAFQEF